MRARYLGNGAGDWKGVTLSPGCEFDVPERLRGLVAANALFQVVQATVTVEAPVEAPKRRGRPPKVTHGNRA